MNTLEYVMDKYKVRSDQKSPIRLWHSRWASLTKLFWELQFTVGAEIGVDRGRFSKIICMLNPQLKLYGIDAWQTFAGYKDNDSQKQLDEFYLEAKRRLASFNCEIIRSWSMDAVKRFKDESLDFVFIDAAHDYDHVKDDIREWSKKVRKGGIVAGHDYIGECNGIKFEVKQAVNEWIKENSIEPLFILKKDGCPTWFYIK